MCLPFKEHSVNKKNPRGIRLHHCSSSPWGVKYIVVIQATTLACVAKDATSICLAEWKPEIWDKWPWKKKERARKKKMGVTRPCPDKDLFVDSHCKLVSKKTKKELISDLTTCFDVSSNSLNQYQWKCMQTSKENMSCLSPFRWRNWWIRGMFTLVMFGAFAVIVYCGPLALILLVSSSPQFS